MLKDIGPLLRWLITALVFALLAVFYFYTKELARHPFMRGGLIGYIALAVALIALLIPLHLLQDKVIANPLSPRLAKFFGSRRRDNIT